MRLEHWFYTIPLRLRSLFRRNQVEQELDEELHFHLEQRIAQEIAAGKTAREAHYTALRAMDGMAQRKENCRDMRQVNLFENLLRDLQYAIRALARTPGFTAITVITLALGIGANTAIFSLVDTVLLKLLPVKAPEQLYLVRSNPQRLQTSWNYPDYVAMRDHNTAFTGLAGYSMGLSTFGLQSSNSANEPAELTYGIFVSGNYFGVLGVTPALGRVFSDKDDRAPGAAPYVVLSYSYWRARFNGDTQVIGQKLWLNGYPLTVIGIAPAGFTGTDVAFRPDVFIPIMMRSEVAHIPFKRWNNRHYWWMAVIGRIKNGTPLSKAEGELYAICKDEESAERRTVSNPKFVDKAHQIVVTPAAGGYSSFATTLKKPLLILFVIVGLVLLIACANIANLMLARGAARQREIAVRLAIGASRGRVITQLLTESILIAILGGAGGIVFSLLGIRVLLSFVAELSWAPGSGIHASVDWRVFGFTIGICILTGLLFGVAPALQSTRPDLVPALKEDSPGSTGARRFTARRALVVAQVALSLPLLAGATLFARTLGNLLALDTGFAPENVFVASVEPSQFGYKGARTRDFFDRLCARVAALPGVRSASLAGITPLSGSQWSDFVTVDGYTWKAGEEKTVWLDNVGRRYFHTIGTPLLLGREFVEQDNPATTIEPFTPGQPPPDAPGQHVAIVNETFARHFFANRSPLGMHVGVGDPKPIVYEIVGVVKDARYFNMREAIKPMMFIPIWRVAPQNAELVIRTTASANQLAALVRREIKALDPVIPLRKIHPLEEDIDRTILIERLVATLSEFFGSIALLLSAVGLYGVLAYTVTRRTREIGIRMAVGADRPSVLWLVFRESILMVSCGTIIGTMAAFAATRAIGSLLYEVSAQDPISILFAAIVLASAATLASLLPAGRAAKVDPLIALRYE